MSGLLAASGAATAHLTPERAATACAAFRAVEALPCDALVTPHPAASNAFPRRHGEVPLADPQTCKACTRNAEQVPDQRLAKEAAAR
ncbi:MAG: hypothetical protein KGL48_17920 [Sphingomonadales bacterium]|nr:hypothetical protein [Sphingomonadales bacterium]MDE2568628.1 hypothetical protein [Sphingomonadales bacterium]